MPSVLLVLLLALPAASSAGAAPPAPDPGLAAPARVDPIQRLQVWTERRRRTRQELDEGDAEELSALLGDLRLVELGAPERGLEAARALVALAVVDVNWSRDDRWGPDAKAYDRKGSIGAIGRRELVWRLDSEPEGPLAPWLAEEFAADERAPREERVLALGLLAGRYVPATLPHLLASLRTNDEEVRRAALEALSGWPDARLHLFFIERLKRGAVDLPILAHFERAQESLGPQARDGLQVEAGRLYTSEDWRDAARARLLVRALSTEQAVPLLIESLAAWTRRKGEDGSRRIVHEIVSELRRRSGRSIGPSPESWNRWWTAVQEGRVELPEDDEEGGARMTSAAFFGLQPVTDRVMFVLDRSGSMEGLFGSTGRNRYDEAVTQLFDYLETAGPETHFGVVLFSDRAELYRDGLRPATPAQLGQLRTWLRSKSPGGGTFLRKGVDRAVGARRGRVEPESIAMDTIVVLCDGATTEGRSWVEPWMRRVNERAQIVFHCVLIGTGGDGTLEVLAERTGGQFVRVPG